MAIEGIEQGEALANGVRDKLAQGQPLRASEVLALVQWVEGLVSRHGPNAIGSQRREYMREYMRRYRARRGASAAVALSS